LRKNKKYKIPVYLKKSGQFSFNYGLKKDVMVKEIEPIFEYKLKDNNKNIFKISLIERKNKQLNDILSQQTAS